MTTSLQTPAPAAPGLAPLRERRRVLASAFAGTTIEWYDFYLYGTAAALVFDTQFFPSESELASTVASFAALATGFLMRPLGGIVGGHLGDRIGRKALLVASLMIMGIASLLIGLLPNHGTIGVWAAIARRPCAWCRDSRPAPNGAAPPSSRSSMPRPGAAGSTDPSHRWALRPACSWPPAPSSWSAR